MIKIDQHPALAGRGVADSNKCLRMKMDFVDNWNLVTDVFKSDRAFSIFLEAVSILLIAPLTARYVNWRAGKRWAPIRKRIIRQVIDFYYELGSSVEIIERDSSVSQALYEKSNDAFKRIFDNNEQDKYIFEHYAGYCCVAHPQDGGKAILLHSPQSFVMSRSPADKESLENLIQGVESSVRDYFFALSPEMIEIISDFGSDGTSRSSNIISAQLHDFVDAYLHFHEETIALQAKSNLDFFDLLSAQIFADLPKRSFQSKKPDALKISKSLKDLVGISQIPRARRRSLVRSLSDFEFNMVHTLNTMEDSVVGGYDFIENWDVNQNSFMEFCATAKSSVAERGGYWTDKASDMSYLDITHYINESDIRDNPAAV